MDIVEVDDDNQLQINTIANHKLSAEPGNCIFAITKHEFFLKNIINLNAFIFNLP